ncbi:MAG TPA: glycosyltransferase [Polyangiaceae bacterium]|jgi:glycosyltransferase involved in cell wall biosynthesis|nr:glycosyltransferase [Polyangiaceae bacterium]
MSEHMVIAHILSSFDMGGQERVALDLARMQVAAGHDVIAISLARGPEGSCAALFRNDGVRADTVAKRFRVDPSLPFRLGRHLARSGVSIVHTHNPHALIYGAPAAVIAGAAAVHTKHGMNPDTPRRLWLRRTAGRLAGAHVAVTPALARVALKSGDCDGPRLHVVPNGVDLTRFKPSRRARAQARLELGIPGDAWVVGTVGRLSPEKAQGLLVDAMAAQLGDRRQLVLVGDGPERAALTARIAATGKARHIHMTGARSDVQNMLAAFDAFALTSRTEGLPLVLLEAMAMGLPVVSTAVGGIPDLVEHRVTGFLLPSGDVARLSRQLAMLANDYTLSRQVGEAGRRQVLARYSLDRMANEYEALYTSLVRQRAGGRMSMPATQIYT